MPKKRSTQKSNCLCSIDTVVDSVLCFILAKLHRLSAQICLNRVKLGLKCLVLKTLCYV